MKIPKVRRLLRAPKSIRLRDQDAGRTPLRDEDGIDQIKQREREATAALTSHIAQYQEMLYARRERKLLLVLQGMDTAGKDGTVRSLFSQINPMGLRAVPFKAPNAEEAAHDFLWRAHRQVPVAGEIAIFNRSHYEDVLVPYVQGRIDARERKRRLAHIGDFERMLAETGTVIVKLFLHISKDEQRKRLQARLDDPAKQWKHDPNDILQRERWDDYQRAYETAFRATDADHAPWYIIPADSKTHRNLLVAALLAETLQDLKLSFPKPEPELSNLKID